MSSWEISESDAYIGLFARVLGEIDPGLAGEATEAACASYERLHLESRYLVTRLYLRSHRFVPESDLLNYLAAEQLALRLEELQAAGWLEQPATLNEILEAASLRDLVALASHFGLQAKIKSEIRAEFLKKCKLKAFFGQQPLAQRITTRFRATSGPYYKLKGARREALQQAAFIYLLPSYGATEDLLVRKNMGLVKFLEYQYYTQRERPLFASREDFAAFYAARQVCDPLEEASEVSNEAIALVEQLPGAAAGTPTTRYSAAYVAGRATHLVARLLGKQGDFFREYSWTKRYLEQTAHRSKRSENYSRQLLLELKFYSEQKDAVWLRRGLNTYFDAAQEADEVSRIDLDRKGQRLQGLLCKAEMPVALDFVVREELPQREEVAIQDARPTGRAARGTRTVWGGTSVEEAALEIYARQGWHGGHFENGTPGTLLMLLVQDILFANKDSFRNEIQTGPIFAARALDAPEVRERIEGDCRREVLAAHKRLCESQPHIGGLNWSIPLECLEAVAGHPGAPGLLERARAGWRGGFPDLTLWNDAGEVKFVEVKSPNDLLSDTQYAWIKALLGLGFDAEVCKMRPRG